MKKVILNYDESTGLLTDKYGVIITTCANLQYEPDVNDVGVEFLIDLKKAGYTCDEITSLKKHDLI